MLALPAAFAQQGLLLATLVLLFSAGVCYFSCEELIRQLITGPAATPKSTGAALREVILQCTTLLLQGKRVGGRVGNIHSNQGIYCTCKLTHAWPCCAIHLPWSTSCAQ